MTSNTVILKAEPITSHTGTWEVGHVIKPCSEFEFVTLSKISVWGSVCLNFRATKSHSPRNVRSASLSQRPSEWSRCVSARSCRIWTALCFLRPQGTSETLCRSIATLFITRGTVRTRPFLRRLLGVLAGSPWLCDLLVVVPSESSVRTV